MIHNFAELQQPGRRQPSLGLATDHGFWELGRFSVAYRDLFGEKPSETLGAHQITGPYSRTDPHRLQADWHRDAADRVRCDRVCGPRSSASPITVRIIASRSTGFKWPSLISDAPHSRRYLPKQESKIRSMCPLLSALQHSAHTRPYRL